MDKENKVFSINELAEYLKVSKKTIRRHISSGKIKCSKVGGVYRISQDALDVFLNPDGNFSEPALNINTEKGEAKPFPRDNKVPSGSMENKWKNHKQNINLVSPANKRLIDVIVVGTGLAGASASATLAELGYNVKSFCFQDSSRRAHSIAAQGGINAAKNYQGDGDSVYRLFYDTVKGGDYRSREANVYRLAEVSTNIIDQCVAQGVPFARDYGGLLDNRSFGGVLVSRTFYAKGQTGQQLLLGAYSAMNRQINRGKIEM